MRFVIGLGTGRCGTTSLAHLLGRQPGATIRHEDAPPLPWPDAEGGYGRALRWLKAKPGPVAGDVAHAWLSALPRLAHDLPVSCVALWRPVEPTVESFLRHLPDTYIQSDGPPGARQFPTYDRPPRDGWRRYVEAYHRRLRHLKAAGHVTVLPMVALNSRAGQRRILRAAGFPDGRHVYVAACHRNAS